MQRVIILNSVNQVIPAIAAELVAVADIANRHLLGKDRLSWKRPGGDFLREAWKTTWGRWMSCYSGSMCSQGHGMPGRRHPGGLVPCAIVPRQTMPRTSRLVTAIS